MFPKRGHAQASEHAARPSAVGAPVRQGSGAAVGAGAAGAEALAAGSTASASETAVEDAAARRHFGESIEEVDPSVVQAEKRTQAALFRLNYYDAPEALAKAVLAIVTRFSTLALLAALSCSVVMFMVFS